MNLKQFSFFFTILCIFSLKAEVQETRQPQDQMPQIQAKARLNHHQRKALIEFHKILKILEQHPGFHDKESNLFNEQFERGKEFFLRKRLKEVNSFFGAIFAIKEFIAGFQDFHTSLNPIMEVPLEWPGFLIHYDGKRFLTSFKNDNQHSNNALITKIDGIPTKQWISENIIHFTNNLIESESSLYFASIQALLWQQNPFIKKPMSICIEKKASELLVEKTIDLTWKPITLKEYAKREAKLLGISPLKDLLNPIKTTSPNKEISWIKIRSFNINNLIQNNFLQKIQFFQFKRTLKKLSQHHTKKIIFDLSGNIGGLTHIPRILFTSLFGFENARKAEEYVLPGRGYRSTTKNAARFNNECLMIADDLFDNLVNQKTENAYSIQDYFPITKGNFKIPEPKDPQAVLDTEFFIIIDGASASTSLLFIEELKQITPKVTLIGQPSASNTSYLDPVMHRTAVGLLSAPIAIIPKRSGMFNKPFIPDYFLSTAKMKDSKWLRESVLEIVNTGTRQKSFKKITALK